MRNLHKQLCHCNVTRFFGKLCQWKQHKWKHIRGTRTLRRNLLPTHGNTLEFPLKTKKRLSAKHAMQNLFIPVEPRNVSRHHNSDPMSKGQTLQVNIKYPPVDPACRISHSLWSIKPEFLHFYPDFPTAL